MKRLVIAAVGILLLVIPVLMTTDAQEQGGYTYILSGPNGEEITSYNNFLNEEVAYQECAFVWSQNLNSNLVEFDKCKVVSKNEQ